MDSELVFEEKREYNSSLWKILKLDEESIREHEN